MQISVINAKELTSDLVGIWENIQSVNPALNSPFFRPEFTRALAATADNIFVAILRDDCDSVTGFFPFELVRPGFGRNLEMCDYQGVIAPSSFSPDPVEIIRGCGLRVWEFDHLLVGSPAFVPFQLHTADSPFLDLAAGYEAYIAALSDDGKRQLTKVNTSARKVERELGPLRFILNTPDAQVMAKMHEWRAGKYGPLPPRSHAALEIIRAAAGDDFAGLLSALYAGDTLIAVHFGVRSRAVWHWWFPTYNPDLPSRYAPGMLMLQHMARSAPSLGARIIDLGKGEADYKEKFRIGKFTVATGSVDAPTLGNLPRIVRRNGLNFIRHRPALHNFVRKAKGIFKSSPTVD